MNHKLIASPTESTTPDEFLKKGIIDESQTAFLGDQVEFSPIQGTVSTGTVNRLNISNKVITSPVVRIRSMCYYFSGGNSPKSRLYMFVPRSYGSITIERHDIPSVQQRVLFAACEYNKQYLIHGGLTSYWGVSSKVDGMKFDAIDPFTYKSSVIQLSGDKISPRYSHNICKIASNKALLYGGIGKMKTACDDAFIIDLDTQEARRTSRPPLAVGCTHSAIVDNVVYYFGGFDQKKHYNTLLSYDISADKWELRTLKDIHTRRSPTLIGYGESLVIIGGRNDLDIFSDVWVVDLKMFATSKLHMTGDLYSGRSGCSCVQVGCNSFLLVGGHSLVTSMDYSYLLSLS